MNDQAFSVAETSANGTVVGTIVATDVDAGQTRTFAVTGGTGQAAFAVNATTGQITVTNSAALNFETTPSFTLNVTVTDNGTPVLSDTAVITINLTNVNEPPVATNDAYTTAEDTTLTVPVGTGVLANDTDPDAGTTLTPQVLANATNGILTLNANGSLSYTPNANFNGTDTFTYRANDGTTNSNLATVTITVTAVNDAPVMNDQAFSVAENSANGTVVGTIVASDVDTGQTRTFAVTGGTGQAAFAVNATTGQITVTNSAALNFETTPSFTLNVTVTDNGTPVLSDTAVITINLTNVNEPPVATNDAYTTAEDTTLTVPVGTGVLANDTDPDAGTTLTAQVVANATNGILTLNANGSLSYTPNANFNGTDTFTYRASDGSLTSNVATVTITVTPVNDAPVV